VASVVFERGANVEAVKSMKGKRSTLSRSFVDDDTSARNSKRGAIKIKISEDAGVGG
jgi:hypothetical protein